MGQHRLLITVRNEHDPVTLCKLECLISLYSSLINCGRADNTMLAPFNEAAYRPVDGAGRRGS